MKPRALFVALLLFAPARAHATQVTVPDDYATIQGALDSHADTVWVRSGTYPETLMTDGHASLLDARDAYGRPSLPVVTSLNAISRLGALRGIVFTGPVYVYGGDIEACWFGAGLDFGYGAPIICNNIVFGDLSGPEGGAFNISMNTVIGGSISANPPGTSDVRRNAVVGPAAVGIAVWSDVRAVNNYVRNCQTGIWTSNSGPSVVLGNVIEECSGPGIAAEGPGLWYGAWTGLVGNTIRRCGADGIHASGNWARTAISGNRVENASGKGIYAHGAGFNLAGNTVLNAGGIGLDIADDGNEAVLLVGNRVTVAASDGAIVRGTSIDAIGNIIGRSGGRGLVATGEHVTARSNTLYLNNETGLELGGGSSATVDSVDHNVAYQNGTGLRWLGSGTAVLGCNDWYKNTAANTEGVLPGPTDLALNPLFCDVDADDVSLSAVSALLQPAGCGLVGALGQGCSYPAAVVPPPSTVETGLRVFPQPGGREVRLSWQATGEPVDVVVYDVVGAHRWRTRTDGNTDGVVWQGVDEAGRLLPAGVYFARIGSAGRQASARVVLVR